MCVRGVVINPVVVHTSPSIQTHLTADKNKDG